MTQNYLNSQKEFFYEETTNLFKLVAPTKRPFDFINELNQKMSIKKV